MLTKLFNFLLITGVIQGLIFNIITLTYLKKKKISKAILYLNLLVLSISLNNLQAWLISKDYTSSWFFIKNLEVPWYVFIVPMFYSFLTHFLIIEDKYRKIIKLFVYIFLIEIILRLILITYSFNTNLSITLIENYTRFEEIFNATLSILLFIKSYKIIFKAQRHYKYVLSFDDIKWLKQFIIIGSFVLAFWVIAIVLNTYSSVPSKYMYFPLRLGSSIVLYWIGYQGFLRYTILRDRIQLRKEIITSNYNKPTNFSKTDTQINVLDNIHNYIQNNKIFLNQNISLNEVAIALNMSSSNLSKIISKHDNFNFSDLINEYRVNHAKSLLLDSNFDNYTIISIGLESGFNSKSTFYSAFKKFTSLTPSKYKKKHLANKKAK